MESGTLEACPCESGIPVPRPSSCPCCGRWSKQKDAPAAEFCRLRCNLPISGPGDERRVIRTAHRMRPQQPPASPKFALPSRKRDGAGPCNLPARPSVHTPHSPSLAVPSRHSRSRAGVCRRKEDASDPTCPGRAGTPLLDEHGAPRDTSRAEMPHGESFLKSPANPVENLSNSSSHPPFFFFPRTSRAPKDGRRERRQDHGHGQAAGRSPRGWR